MGHFTSSTSRGRASERPDTASLKRRGFLEHPSVPCQICAEMLDITPEDAVRFADSFMEDGITHADALERHIMDWRMGRALDLFDGPDDAVFCAEAATGERNAMAETSLFQQSVVHHDAFREALREFERTRKLPAPDEASPAWRAWDAACVAAHRAVVASVDHYCARRVHDVLAFVLAEREANGTAD